MTSAEGVGANENSRTSTSPEQHRRLKELVEAALDLPVPERDSYMEQACGGNSRMLAQVRDLLQLYREEDDVAPLPGEPDQIGPYRLITELGAGGMGVVYLAQREDGFSRTVAIKVIRRGMDTDYFLTRFQQEREILGALDHPGIVRIVDGGSTADGRPYLVMDLVDGVRIDAFCENLSIKSRIGLFLKVCAAIQHAHRNLIVHRDLKPGNILVTPGGQPKLLDFGIAKVLDRDDNEATSATIPIMTRQYASPEQIRGRRVNTSSDIYALGLILYELLAGVKPYDLKDIPAGDAERIICEVEPPEASKRAPTAVASQLRGDLDRILAKAMRKEPERRYPSVEAFAADLERYLAGRPVSAQRDTFAYRASKFVERNRGAVAAASAMLALLLGGAGSTWWQARIASSERARAEREAALAKSSEAEARRQEFLAQSAARDAVAQRDRAEQKVREADRLRQVAEQRSRDVRAMANSLLFEFHGKIRDLPGATDARRFLIVKATEVLEQLRKEAGADPAVQADVAAAYEQLGQLQGAAEDAALNDIRGAYESQIKALEIRSAMAAAHPGNPAYQRDLAASQLRMAELYQALRQPLPAIEIAGRASKVYENLLRTTPTDMLSLLGLAAAQEAVGLAYESAGKLESAASAYAAHTATRRRIQALSPHDPDVAAQTAEARDLQARTLEVEGRFAEALRIVEESGEIYRRAAAANPNSMSARRSVIRNHRSIGSLYERVGEVSAAQQRFQSALDMTRQLIAADPRNVRLLGEEASLRASLGSVLFRMGSIREAEGHLAAAIAGASSLAAKDRDNPSLRLTLANAHLGLGQVQLEGGARSEAAESFAHAMQLFEALALASPKDINIQINRALAHIGAGRIWRDMKDLDAAGRSFREAIAILEKSMPGSRDHRLLTNMGIAYNRLADVYRLQDRGDQALATYARTATIVDHLLQMDPRNASAFGIQAEALSRSGLIHEQKRDWPAALRAYESATAFDEKLSARDPSDKRAKANLAESYFRVCEVRFRLMQYEAAFEACRRANTHWRAAAQDPLALASGLMRAGDIRMAQSEEDSGAPGLRAEACAFYREAATISPSDLTERLARCKLP